MEWCACCVGVRGGVRWGVRCDTSPATAAEMVICHLVSPCHSLSSQILRDMRLKLGPDPDLVAYWSFDDPDETSGVFQETAVATDSSGET